jgi:predicted phosphate transport protein (TIGR00153 family)
VLNRLIPRDEQFFVMFTDLARRVTAAARLLDKLFAEPQNLAQYVSAIKDLEHEADVITHSVIGRIHKVFVTPIDREDIHLLVQELDDVIDMIDGCARRAQMFQIREVRESGRKLAEVLVRATEAIEWAVTSMKQAKIVEARSREIKRLEEEGDAVYNAAVAELFSGNPDALEVIKWKELYDTMERALDQCEDVANVLESITIKHA